MKYLCLFLLLFSYQASSCDYGLSNPPEGFHSLVNFTYKSELEKDAFLKTIEYFVAQQRDPYEYFSTGIYTDIDKGHLIMSLKHYSSFCIKGVAGNPSGKDGRLTYDSKTKKVVSYLLYQ